MSLEVNEPAIIDVVSFGGGVQSTALLTLAGEGRIPMPSRWLFSDPGFESRDTYAHIERCKEYLSRKGGRLDVVSAGNIRNDAIEFARLRANSDVKRYASIPLFVLNTDGSQGVLPRQCTTEYKIEPIEEFYRREVLKLKFRQHAPKSPAINAWIGISADEERRASAPGRWRNVEVPIGQDLFGETLTRTVKRWEPVPWQLKSYPLLGYTLFPDRTRQRDDRFAECEGWDRDDALNWLAKVWPHPVPRSACICCPYRTNSEWRDMRDARPEEFAQAVEFDSVIREAYATGSAARRELHSRPYLHRTLVPLSEADLDEPLNDRMGCGGLFSQEPDGICGV